VVWKWCPCYLYIDIANLLQRWAMERLNRDEPLLSSATLSLWLFEIHDFVVSLILWLITKILAAVLNTLFSIPSYCHLFWGGLQMRSKGAIFVALTPNNTTLIYNLQVHAAPTQHCRRSESRAVKRVRYPSPDRNGKPSSDRLSAAPWRYLKRDDRHGRPSDQPHMSISYISKAVAFIKDSTAFTVDRTNPQKGKGLGRGKR
jgi:hypothetical protein